MNGYQEYIYYVKTHLWFYPNEFLDPKKPR